LEKDSKPVAAKNLYGKYLAKQKSLNEDSDYSFDDDREREEKIKKWDAHKGS
jgi:hypothetical protein